MLVIIVLITVIYVVFITVFIIVVIISCIIVCCILAVIIVDIIASMIACSSVSVNIKLSDQSKVWIERRRDGEVVIEKGIMGSDTNRGEEKESAIERERVRQR